MSLPARIAAFLLACLVCTGVGCRLGLTIKQGEWDASVVAGREAQDKALRAAAEALRSMAPAQAKIIERVTRETVEKPVYRDCRHSKEAFDSINSAISGDSEE
jgi:hypothetical protein